MPKGPRLLKRRIRKKVWKATPVGPPGKLPTKFRISVVKKPTCRQVKEALQSLRSPAANTIKFEAPDYSNVRLPVSWRPGVDAKQKIAQLTQAIRDLDLKVANRDAEIAALKAKDSEMLKLVAPEVLRLMEALRIQPVPPEQTLWEAVFETFPEVVATLANLKAIRGEIDRRNAWREDQEARFDRQKDGHERTVAERNDFAQRCAVAEAEVRQLEPALARAREDAQSLARQRDEACIHLARLRNAWKVLAGLIENDPTKSPCCDAPKGFHTPACAAKADGKKCPCGATLNPDGTCPHTTEGRKSP